MNKLYLLLLIVACLSCSSYRQSKTYKQIARYGYTGMKYRFSDSGARNIVLTFQNDSTLSVTNKTDIAQIRYLLNFDCTYSYKWLDIASVEIREILSSNKELHQHGYIKPYDNRQFVYDKNAVKMIFPDIVGDTLRFSGDYKKLQIREFSFDRIE
ncbi:hypothetical protein EYV94_28205 [Puteibacter caeruleilacunae]|nr:hypothetical protein EYV94_28205 [Puteibacter caeruleilacunae]